MASTMASAKDDHWYDPLSETQSSATALGARGKAIPGHAQKLPSKSMKEKQRETKMWTPPKNKNNDRPHPPHLEEEDTFSWFVPPLLPPPKRPKSQYLGAPQSLRKLRRRPFYESNFKKNPTVRSSDDLPGRPGTWCQVQHLDRLIGMGLRDEKKIMHSGVSGQSLAASLPRNEKKHQALHTSNNVDGRQKTSTPPTIIDLIQHGYHLVEIEKIWYGKKTLMWRIQYRNRDGLLLSLLWGYLSRSWIQAWVVYITTHILSEVALWYTLGRRCSHTFGTQYIHPADLRRRKITEHDKTTNMGGDPIHPPLEIQKDHEGVAMQILSPNKGRRMSIDPPKSSETRIAISEAAQEIKSTTADVTMISYINHRAMASKIITLAKGKRRKLDRPRRYRKWQQNVNAKSLPSTKVNATKVKLCTTPHHVIVQRPTATATTISSPMLNELDDMMDIQVTSTHNDANLVLNKMETSLHGMRKRSNIIARLLMNIAFRKLLTIHDNQKRFMADCAWPGVWANVGIIHQHQRDPTRATNHVLAGFYPRDFIRWLSGDFFIIPERGEGD